MNTIKKILTLVLVLGMLVSMLALTSCNKDKEDGKNDDADNKTNENTYTVTVVDGDNNPVAGVGIMISTTYDTLTTDANGKITFESENAGATVMIMSVPSGYEDPKSAAVGFSSGSKELTLTVKKIVKTTVTYTVTVKDQNGDAVSGVTVQLCTDKMCYDTVTNENGVGTKELDPGIKYDIKITASGTPEGYTAPDGYFASIPADETEIEIVITKN